MFLGRSLFWRMNRMLLLLSISFLAACSGVYFVPDRNLVRTPADVGLEYREWSVVTEDGVVLDGWFLPGLEPVKGTVLFLHGNAQNISYHLASVAWLPRRHFNIFLYDYRGFGKSGGRSDVYNAVADVEAVIDKVAESLGSANQNIIIFGQSLGAAIAIAAVARHRGNAVICGLVADSAFSGFREIGREKLAELTLIRPAAGLLSRLLPSQPNLLEDIAAVSPIPVLLIHGEKDRIVPPEHSKTLFAAAREPKALWIEPEVGHIMALSHASLRDRLLRFLEEALSDCGATAIRGRTGQ